MRAIPSDVRRVTTVMDGFVRSRGESVFLGRGAGSAFVGDRGLLNPALQGFRLRFTNGRHQLHRLAVELDTEYVTAWLADGGHDDYFIASVDWIDFPDP